MSTVPARPAAYVRVEDATSADDPDLTMQRDLVTRAARELAWPVPAVYADAGQPGSRYAELVEAVAAGRHDAVIVEYPGVIGHLGQIEAFDRHCRQHGARLYAHYGWPVSDDTRGLFGVIYGVKEFTVTDEHLRLLRRAHVWWDEAEFGAPSINPKRPYGNSNVYADIAEILGVPDSEWDDEELGALPDAAWRFTRLHVETGIALQIALDTGEFRAGGYIRDNEWGYGLGRWRRDDA
jgi:hypothetical protein